MFSAKTNNEIDFDTVISARTEIVGDITVKGAIQIDGILKGNLIAEPGSKASVRISDKGRVEGKIIAPNIIINGDVKGDIHAYEYIELAKKARITGDVYYSSMEMVLGAQVNGQLLHNVDTAPNHSDHLDKSKPAAKVD
ncbi:MAG: cell shape determination protein CcmA [Oceanobacter sp.]|jgi:cytoskeletal protein CcmA (bactofilin family)|nr:MAG: cell shape determination protein CcmA [Oceanobacter sp.]